MVGLAFPSCRSGKGGGVEKERVDTIPILVEQIRKCSRLYTAEVKVHKIVTHDDKMTVRGKLLQQDVEIPLPMGQRKVAIPIDATVKAYIDLDGFSARNIRRRGDKVEVVLPDPRVTLTASKINHGEIKKYVALMRQGFTDEELASYERQGRDAIIKDIPQMDITDMAEESAARIIQPLFVAMGYREEDITVTFRKDFTRDDILRMVDVTTEVEGK